MHIIDRFDRLWSSNVLSRESREQWENKWYNLLCDRIDYTLTEVQNTMKLLFQFQIGSKKLFDKNLVPELLIKNVFLSIVDFSDDADVTYRMAEVYFASRYKSFQNVFLKSLLAFFSADNDVLAQSAGASEGTKRTGDVNANAEDDSEADSDNDSIDENNQWKTNYDSDSTIEDGPQIPEQIYLSAFELWNKCSYEFRRIAMNYCNSEYTVHAPAFFHKIPERVVEPAAASNIEYDADHAYEPVLLREMREPIRTIVALTHEKPVDLKFKFANAFLLHVRNCQVPWKPLYLEGHNDYESNLYNGFVNLFRQGIADMSRNAEIFVDLVQKPKKISQFGTPKENNTMNSCCEFEFFPILPFMQILVVGLNLRKGYKTWDTLSELMTNNTKKSTGLK